MSPPPMYTPLSWAIGERVIGGWDPSGPFPELCGANVEPAGEHGSQQINTI